MATATRTRGPSDFKRKMLQEAQMISKKMLPGWLRKAIAQESCQQMQSKFCDKCVLGKRLMHKMHERLCFARRHGMHHNVAKLCRRPRLLNFLLSLVVAKLHLQRRRRPSAGAGLLHPSAGAGLLHLLPWGYPPAMALCCRCPRHHNDAPQSTLRRPR